MDHSGFCSYHVLVSRAEAQKQHQQQSAHSRPGVHLGFWGCRRFFGTACMSHRELRVYIPWRGGRCLFAEISGRCLMSSLLKAHALIPDALPQPRPHCCHSGIILFWDYSVMPAGAPPSARLALGFRWPFSSSDGADIWPRPRVSLENQQITPSETKDAAGLRLRASRWSGYVTLKSLCKRAKRWQFLTYK